MIRIAFALVVGVAIAHAQPADREARARALAEEGTARFQQYDYAGAVAKFKEAFELNADPSFLFNIAQAYRLAGDCPNAADYYGRFLTEVPDPPNAEKIRGWHTSQVECAKARAKREQPPPPPPPPPTEEPRSGRLGLVIAFGATSAVGFGFGTFFLWDAIYLKSQRADFIDNCSVASPCPAGVVNDYDARGSRANALAAIGMTVGGVALAATAAVYFLSRESETPVAMVPISGGAMIAGGFRF